MADKILSGTGFFIKVLKIFKSIIDIMAIINSSENPQNEIPSMSLFRRNARFFMGMILVVTDYITLTLCGWIAITFWFLVKQETIPDVYQGALPYILAFIVVYFLMGLYSPGSTPVDELRRLLSSTTFVFMFLLALLFWFQNAELYSRVSLTLAWILALILLPITRWLVRRTLCKFNIWGEPVAIIGYGQLGYKLVTYLIGNPMLGFMPYVVIDRRKSDRPDSRPSPKGITVKSIHDMTPEGKEVLAGVNTAILVTSEIPGDFYESVTDIRTLKFARLIIVSIVEQTSRLWMQPYDIGGIIGLEVGQNLLSTWQQTIKRVIDLALILISLPVTVLVVAAIGILVAIDSRGPIFYSSERIGKSGNLFQIWKFRTMVPDADNKLQQYLEQNPDLLAEWKATQKLKNDPRVTRVGAFLRKYSLDELPNIWNVVIGDMSLVGPRPISMSEKDAAHYGKCYNLYVQVRPGCTGLWQISGRSDTSYDERVRMDEYYVRNWSVWLDMIILARTPLAVIQGRGAY